MKLWLGLAPGPLWPGSERVSSGWRTGQCKGCGGVQLEARGGICWTRGRAQACPGSGDCHPAAAREAPGYEAAGAVRGPCTGAKLSECQL